VKDSEEYYSYRDVLLHITGDSYFVFKQDIAPANRAHDSQTAATRNFGIHSSWAASPNSADWTHLLQDLRSDTPALELEE